MGYLGNTPTTQNFISGTDYFNGDGSTTAFTLSRTVNSVNDIEAVINNVVQQPNTAYTLSGTTITFTSAPSAGTSNIYVRYLSTTTQVITPSQNTVSYSTMNTDMQGLFAQSFTNRIINGAMMIDQRNAGASVTPTVAGYTLDRWRAALSQASKYSVQQSSVAPNGFTNSALITSLSAYTVGSAESFRFEQFVEGFNASDLGWGTANAQTVTLSFWVRSSLTGTFGGAFLNSAENRSYPFSYTISSANTWEQKTITVAGDTSGTWLTNNGIGIRVSFSLGAGSTVSGTAGSWSGNFYTSATGATSVVGTNGATFYITGVQLEKGSTATSFDYRPYGTELQLCQRYCYIVQNVGGGNGNVMGFGNMTNTLSGTRTFTILNTPTPLRASPTITFSGVQVFGPSFSSTTNITSMSVYQQPNVGSKEFYTELNAASGLSGTSMPILTASTSSFIQFSAEL